MNEENEKRLTDVIIDLGLKVDNLGKVTSKLERTVDKHSEQIAKLNIAIHEMRTSYMKLDATVSKLDENLSERISNLDDSFNKYAQRNDDRADNHQTRIVRLEEKTSGGSYIAREPAAQYKKKKRK